MLDKVFSLKLLLVLLTFLFAAPGQSLSAENNKVPDFREMSYVVIGAFAYHKNAIRFVAFAREKSLDAKYAMNVERQLYYVYVFASPFMDDAVWEIQRIREMPEFPDVWIYTGQLAGAKHGPEEAVSPPGELQIAKAGNEPRTHVSSPALPERETDVVEAAETSAKEAATREEKKAALPEIKPEENYYYLYLNTVNTKNLKEVVGNIKVIDIERLKEIDEVKSHEVVKLKDPNNGTRRVKLATDIFGFKKVEHVIDLDNPLNDTTDIFTDVIGDSIIVDFKLNRFRKGDVLVMYNVYFYINAAIMKPESIYELNHLLDMLRENDDLKVRIHGHTNGNSRGKIIKLNPKDKSYFSLNANHKETTGSAKKLSLSRAYTIQQWLVDQGIEENRMEIKGWGGRRMIYGKHDIQAYKNVRVEVEITEE